MGNPNERGDSGKPFSGVDLSNLRIDILRVTAYSDPISAEVANRFSLARREAQRIRTVWFEDSTRIQSQLDRGLYIDPTQFRLLEALKKKISGEQIPGKAARKSVYRAAGSLPRGWVREIFGYPKP